MPIFKALKRIGSAILNKHQVTDGDGAWASIDAGAPYVERAGDTSPQALVRHNRNFVMACLNKVATYSGSVSPHVYYYSDMDGKKLVSGKRVSAMQRKRLAAEPRVLKSVKDAFEVTDSDHPLVKFVRRPCQSEDYSWPEWIGLTTRYLLSMGNMLYERETDGDTLVGLRPLMWEYASVQMINGKIDAYHYSPPNDYSRQFKPGQVVHLLLRDIGSTVVGKGAAEGCVDSASLHHSYDRYAIALANNYGIPGVHLGVKNRVSNREEAEKLAREFQRKFNRDNNGKPVVTFGDVDVTPLQTTVRDMDFQQGRRWSLKTICAVLGVPEDLVNVEDSNRASSTTAIKSFMRLTILPLVGRILEQINSQVVAREFDESAFVWYDESEVLAADPSEQKDILTAYVDKGIMTADEAREALGLPPLGEQEGPADAAVPDEPAEDDNQEAQ